MIDGEIEDEVTIIISDPGDEQAYSYITRTL
jgi:hypothetical protein